jgi:AmmeMemoRadiSam system protein A
MAPSPWCEPHVFPAEAQLLLDIADHSIVTGLARRRPLLPDPAELPVALRRVVGSFVTLHVLGQLNGCIGSIRGSHPLGVSVARQAWSAAFADPRLPELRPTDYRHLDIEVSVLSPLVGLPVESHQALLAELRPDVDGLLIGAGSRRALFLPAVWDALPDPAEFLDHLYLKAGLAPGSWPAGMRAFRFTAERARRPAPTRAPA